MTHDELSTILSALCEGEEVTIVKTLDKDEEASLLLINVEDIETSVVLYVDGTVFHPHDWQDASYPCTFAEIGERPDFGWRTVDDRPAVVLNNKPRVFM